MTIVNSTNNDISLILLDEDPIFSLGFQEICRTEEFSQINIIATGKIKDFSALLASSQVDLLVVAIDFDRFESKANFFIKTIPQIIKQYPHLKIVLLVNPASYLFYVSQIDYIQGICYKYTDIQEIIKTCQKCVAGTKYVSKKKTPLKKGSKFSYWFYQQCKQGIKNISGEINQLNSYTKESNLSTVDLIYWQGRKRELKLTKWLLKKAIPKNKLNLSIDFPDSSATENEENIEQGVSTPETTEIGDLAIIDRSDSTTYDLILAKIKNPLPNLTKQILEIDILKINKKQELLTLIIDRWYQLINNFQESELPEKDILESIYDEIFLDNLMQELYLQFLSKLNQEKNIVKSTLSVKKDYIKTLKYKIKDLYFADNILLYQILAKDLFIDQKRYEYDSPNAQEIETIVMENIILTMANWIVADILNDFYDNPQIKNQLFKTELKSSRQVAMFRNNLLWKERRQKYWLNPRHIFEDKFVMLKFSYRGIETTNITHSRHSELATIQGLPWLVTILIELRDSLSRGVKAFGDTLGQVIVYLLTEVIGKGIGLIGKGILQGIGSKIKS